VNYWLFKSEPGTFGIDHLAQSKRKTTSWDGVRNYTARNFMRDDMKKGDLGFFYHSSCDVPGIAGIVTVSSAAHPDTTAFDSADDHHDSDSDPANPRWYAVDITLKKPFKRIITLDELRTHATSKLKDLLILRRGNRLSITPVSKHDWEFILSLE
jgi:predicted RNA-binding protein with PUA-like domain